MAPSDEDLGPSRVLMIDDSKMICKAIGQKLADEEAVFETCNDPAEALDRAREFRPTVILLDLEMPKITGFDLLPLLRDDPLLRDVPVIVLSAISEPQTKARAFLLGANDYAEKQMDKVELASRIRYHTRGYINSQRLNESITDLLEARKRLEIQRNFIRKTFGRYLSDEVVGNILDTPEGLELGGEKRAITILMSDLRGFTSLSERLPPEDVLSIINNFLLVMTDILMKYNGTIDEFIGDAILAMFGAPVLREDDALRAVACAVEMQLAMEDVNRWNREQGYPDVAMGIGLNTGEVVVGNIGSERRCKYGIVGRHVNLAARIESYTVGGQILVPEQTLQACGDLLRIDDQMEVMPKGVKEPITIYDVGGVNGPYDLQLPEKVEVTLAPLEPLMLQYTVISGKHASTNLLPGTMVKLLDDTAEVVVDEPVEQLTNLKMVLRDRQGAVITDELYGKVLVLDGDDPPALRVRFTSVTPEARAFLLSLQPEGPT